MFRKNTFLHQDIEPNRHYKQERGDQRETETETQRETETERGLYCILRTSISQCIQATGRLNIERLLQSDYIALSWHRSVSTFWPVGHLIDVLQFSAFGSAALWTSISSAHSGLCIVLWTSISSAHSGLCIVLWTSISSAHSGLCIVLWTSISSAHSGLCIVL